MPSGRSGGGRKNATAAPGACGGDSFRCACRHAPPQALTVDEKNRMVADGLAALKAELAAYNRRKA